MKITDLYEQLLNEKNKKIQRKYTLTFSSEEEAKTVMLFLNKLSSNSLIPAGIVGSLSSHYYREDWYKVDNTNFFIYFDEPLERFGSDDLPVDYFNWNLPVPKKSLVIFHQQKGVPSMPPFPKQGIVMISVPYEVADDFLKEVEFSRCDYELKTYKDVNKILKYVENKTLKNVEQETWSEFLSKAKNERPSQYLLQIKELTQSINEVMELVQNEIEIHFGQLEHNLIQKNDKYAKKNRTIYLFTDEDIVLVNVKNELKDSFPKSIRWHLAFRSKKFAQAFLDHPSIRALKWLEPIQIISHQYSRYYSIALSTPQLIDCINTLIQSLSEKQMELVKLLHFLASEEDPLFNNTYLFLSLEEGLIAGLKQCTPENKLQYLQKNISLDVINATVLEFLIKHCLSEEINIRAIDVLNAINAISPGHNIQRILKENNEIASIFAYLPPEQWESYFAFFDFKGRDASIVTRMLGWVTKGKPEELFLFLSITGILNQLSWNNNTITAVLQKILGIAEEKKRFDAFIAFIEFIKESCETYSAYDAIALLEAMPKNKRYSAFKILIEPFKKACKTWTYGFGRLLELIPDENERYEVLLALIEPLKETCKTWSLEELRRILGAMSENKRCRIFKALIEPIKLASQTWSSYYDVMSLLELLPQEEMYVAIVAFIDVIKRPRIWISWDLTAKTSYPVYGLERLLTVIPKEKRFEILKELIEPLKTVCQKWQPEDFINVLKLIPINERLQAITALIESLTSVYKIKGIEEFNALYLLIPKTETPAFSALLINALTTSANMKWTLQQLFKVLLNHANDGFFDKETFLSLKNVFIERCLQTMKKEVLKAKFSSPMITNIHTIFKKNETGELTAELALNEIDTQLKQSQKFSGAQTVHSWLFGTPESKTKGLYIEWSKKIKPLMDDISSLNKKLDSQTNHEAISERTKLLRGGN